MSFQDITGKPHISPSQIETFLTCGLRYKFRYLDNIKSPPGAALVIGSGTHKGIELDLTAKIDTGELAPLEDVQDATRDATRHEWESGDVVDESETIDTATDTAVGLVTVHHKEHAPTLKPAAVEREFRLQVDGYPVPLFGYADIVETTGAIRDTKTAAKKKSQADIDNSLQLTLYHWAHETEEQASPTGLYFDVLVKKKAPEVQVLETVRGDADRVRLLAYMENLIEAVEAGVFHPAAPGSWMCSEKWCGYWDRCKFGSAGRSVKS